MVLKAYMMAMDPDYVDVFEVMYRDATARNCNSLSPRSRTLSMQLYHVLVMLPRAKLIAGA